MIAHQHLPSYTYQDYSTWKGDWELIGGIPYSLSPSPKRGHQYVMSRLAGQLYNELANCDCQYYFEHDWIVDESTVIRPDLYITCDQQKDDYQRTPPQLIVEILSPSTSEKDRLLKYKIYEGKGVRYYLIVDPDKKLVSIYLLINKRYEKIAETSDQKHEFELEGSKVLLDFSSIWLY